MSLEKKLKLTGRKKPAVSVPVGELIPLRGQTFVPADVAVATFVGSPRIRFKRFRRDVDGLIDQDPTPRG